MEQITRIGTELTGVTCWASFGARRLPLLDLPETVTKLIIAEDNRIVDAQGNSWLGRLVFEQHIVQLYTKLGIAKTEDLPVNAIARAVLSGRSVELVRPFAMTVKRAIVNGNQRVELVGAPADQLPWLKSLGCFTEIIQYRTRLFVPVEDAETILARVLRTG